MKDDEFSPVCTFDDLEIFHLNFLLNILINIDKYSLVQSISASISQKSRHFQSL